MIHTLGSNARTLGGIVGRCQLVDPKSPRDDAAEFDSNVEHMLATLDTNPTNHKCFTNIEVTTRIAVPDQSITPSRYFWIEAGSALRIEREYKSRFSGHIDVICANTAVSYSPRLFETVVLDDVVVFSMAGRESFALPQFEVAEPTISVTYPGGMLPDVALSLRLDALKAGSRKTVEELGIVSQWYLAFLRERDPLKKFLFGFATLEAVTDRWAGPLATRAIEQLAIVRDGKTMDPAAEFLSEYIKVGGGGESISIRQRFGIVALALFPEDANNDIIEFAKAAKARNEIAHGRRMPSGDPPVGLVMGLAEKYVRAALDERLLQRELDA
jgi:hypothetical protein